MKKRRLSASVDADLIEAAEAATATGEVPNLSSWVNLALGMKLDHDRRLRALGEFIEAFEAGHGVITPEELARASRVARSRAVTPSGGGTR